MRIVDPFRGGRGILVVEDKGAVAEVQVFEVELKSSGPGGVFFRNELVEGPHKGGYVQGIVPLVLHQAGAGLFEGEGGDGELIGLKN